MKKGTTNNPTPSTLSFGEGRGEAVIGIDYGTDSCRALLINAHTGEELATAVSYYSRWKKGLYCSPVENRYRQHPLDYIESLEEAVKGVLNQVSGEIKDRIVGIGFDTTGSTPVLLDRNGTPLALLPEFQENPNAMFVLWKDHTAIREAEEINKLAKEWTIDYTSYSGGVYSSEWVWSKMLHILREDESLRETAYSWAEHCDWMPALLTGNTRPEEMIRSRCAAGHKAMWNEKWGGLPSFEFLKTLDPLLGIFEGHLFENTYTSDTVVGNLSEEWAERLGLTTQVAICVSELDCHMGAVGAQIKPGSFVRVIGTSTCDVMVAPYDELNNKLISGICGQVDGSVISGYVGLEAGQSAFGDIYAWYKRMLTWPVKEYLSRTELLDEATKEKLLEEYTDSVFSTLTCEAEQIKIEDNSLIAVDWLNGRRTPIANQGVKGTVYGLTLGTTAPLFYRSLVEATAYGSKSIVECFIRQGININEVIAIGGISLKSSFVMQILADVLGMPIKVSKAEQACALGASMFAAVAAGIYSDINEAQMNMGQGFVNEFLPDMENHNIYMERYEKYIQLGQFTENKLM